MSEPIDVAVDPSLWDRFHQVHPLVVVGTREPDGSHDLAPKHLAMPVSWEPWFGFVCHPSHGTWKNAVRTGVFTVSYPRPDQLVGAVLTASPRCEDGAKPAVAALPVRAASAVDGVLVQGAAAWLECELDRVIEGLGDNGMLIGRIVHAAVAADMLRDPDQDPGEQLLHHPVLAYLHPWRFTAVGPTQGLPRPAGFKR